MLVALPLIDSVVGVAAAALAEEPGGVGEAPAVPDAPDEVLDVPVAVLAPDEALCVPGALVWTSTEAGEHPSSVADETNTTVMTLGNLMGSSWPSASRMSPNDDISMATRM